MSFCIGTPDHLRDAVNLLADLIDKEKQIGGNSVDIRLGNEFIIFRKNLLSAIDPIDKKNMGEKIGLYQERIRLNFREKFVLHPNHLVLGSILEYIVLSDKLSAYVIGRSSWGRLGLIIATAISVSPKFKGAFRQFFISLRKINEKI
ncbi:MAG: 2'-deoxycytidine 5'-triphosphate deaminase [Syntrophobacterales bacterium]